MFSGAKNSSGRTVPATTPKKRFVSSLFVRSASFNFFASDWNPVANRPCANARKLEVEPPGDHGWLAVASKIPACAVLYVDPLVPGRTDARWGTVGSQHFAHP